jgi:hypothetical protein
LICRSNRHFTLGGPLLFPASRHPGPPQVRCPFSM